MITCPADLTFFAGEGNMNATANWTQPVGTDNSGVVTTNSTILPVVLPIGTHEYTYTATDGSGNTASCSFDVTIAGE